MASRIPRGVPNIPIGAIVGAVGASAGLAGIGYLGFNAVYSGEYAVNARDGGG
jgi:hypothetical protein